MTINYLHTTLRFLLLFLWGPACAAGLVASVPASILNIQPAIIVLTGVFSTLAGLTTLAIRLNAELDKTQGTPLPRPGLYCAAHMLGSWLAGAFAFLMCQHFQIDVWLSFANVLLGSFGGATTLEKMANRWLPGFPLPAAMSALVDPKTHAILTIPGELSPGSGTPAK